MGLTRLPSSPTAINLTVPPLLTKRHSKRRVHRRKRQPLRRVATLGVHVRRPAIPGRLTNDAPVDKVALKRTVGRCDHIHGRVKIIKTAAAGRACAAADSVASNPTQTRGTADPARGLVANHCASALGISRGRGTVAGFPDCNVLFSTARLTSQSPEGRASAAPRISGRDWTAT